MNERRVMKLLREIRILLEKQEVKPWTREIIRLEDRIRHANCHEARLEAIDALDDLYGGMGSFNDLFITARNSNLTSQGEEINATDKLNKLRSDLFRALHDL